MRKVFLDELPRWEKGEGMGRPGSINWKKCVGRKVKFIYDDLSGEVDIVDCEGDYLWIKYLDSEPFKVATYSFTKCKLGKVLNKRTDKFRFEIGQRIKDKKRDFVIIDRKYIQKEMKPDDKGRIYIKNEKWYKYKCNKCGFDGNKHYKNGTYKEELYTIEYVLLNGGNCACCESQIVVENINDIPTTNPEIVCLFKNGYNAAKKYSIGSGSREEIICDVCGEVRRAVISSIKEDMVCEKCKGLSISKAKRACDIKDSFEFNDAYNRLKYWDYDKNAKLPHEVYKGSSEKFWFICENNHSFKVGISSINGKKATWCLHCANLLVESKMASILKQVLKHEFPNTIWEYDAGFKGKNGGNSKYDIYVPELNLLIECQSEYHDNKKEMDNMKRNFALNNGYDFLEIDHRDFDILSCLQIFFPFLNEVPNYVIYTKNVKINWDIEEAQRLLDETDLTQSEVAEHLGITLGALADKVHRGILRVPKHKKIGNAVVQLNFDGEFIRRHDKASEFKQYGFNTPDICSCCKGNQKTHKGFLFMYEEIYDDIKDENGNIKVKEDYRRISKNANKKEVIQFDLSGNFIAKYDSLSDASRINGFDVRNISACCNKKVKTSNGFIWKYEEEDIE